MDDAAFGQLLDYLNLDWKGYRKVRKGVKKRIRRHMLALGCQGLSDYLAVLNDKLAIREECDRHMTVSISRFFREHALWTALEERLLPELIDFFPEKIRIWSAGCACGEEAYSFAIVWALLKKKTDNLPAVELLATDTNEASLGRARIGRYPPSSIREVPVDLRSDYFESRKGGKQFQVREFLKQDVLFRPHDLLSGSPKSRFHLIFIRNNLLTYYQDQIKGPVFHKILEALTPRGLLIVGAQENVPLDTGRLSSDNQFDYVLRAVA